MKNKRLLLLISLLLTALLLFTACASAAPANLTADEIAARQTDEKYAYTNAYAWTSMEALPAFNELNELPNYLAVAEVTLCSEISSYDVLIPPNVGDPPQKVTGYFVRARIDSLLDCTGELQEKEEVLLWVGSNAIYPEPELYRKGERYVMFLSTPWNLSEFAKEFAYYESLPFASFYVTEDNYILPMSGDDKVITDCAGMNLDNFKAYVKEQFK